MKHCIYLFLGLLLITSACKKTEKDQLAAPLAVKTFWPNSGKAGTIVTLNGTGFAHTAADITVSFNGEAATVVSVKDTVLVVLAPEKGSTGKVSVKLNSKTVDAGDYTYQDLTMQAVSPLNGPAGTNIAIHGAGFGSINAPAKVTVNGKDALITSVNDTLLIAAVPTGAGSGPVKVIVDGKEVAGPDFTFQNISKIKPLKGGKGTQVTITGEGFSTVANGNTIEFNGKAGTVISATGTQLVVATPADVATGPLTVTVNAQKTVGPVFTVIPPPALTVVTPLSSPAGQDVTITGNYFSALVDEDVVNFNGVPAIVKSASEKQLVVTIPTGAGSGNMSVWVNGQQTGGPLFKEQNLGIIKLTPDNGLAGTEVVVSGIGFSTTLTDNVVKFNGVAATVISATETELEVQAPTGFTTGAVQMQVSTLNATGPVFKRAGVMTFAGGPSAGIFSAPTGIAVDASGTLYVLDQNQVKKVSATGTVSAFAGSVSGAGGHQDGVTGNALFLNPQTIVIDGQNNLYVRDGDYTRGYIRKITPAGEVTTVLNLAENLPYGLGVSQSGTLYFSRQYSGITRIESNGSFSKINGGYSSVPKQMAVDNAGQVYYGGGDYYNPYIQMVTTEPRYVRLAGDQSNAGFADGQGASALLYSPQGVALSPVSGNIIFIDDLNYAVRSVTTGGQVTTITGAAGTFNTYKSGYADGTLGTALFGTMTGLCIDQSGNIYIMDQGNKAIRKVFLQ